MSGISWLCSSAIWASSAEISACLAATASSVAAWAAAISFVEVRDALVEVGDLVLQLGRRGVEAGDRLLATDVDQRLGVGVGELRRSLGVARFDRHGHDVGVVGCHAIDRGRTAVQPERLLHPGGDRLALEDRDRRVDRVGVLGRRPRAVEEALTRERLDEHLGARLVHLVLAYRRHEGRSPRRAAPGTMTHHRLRLSTHQ